MDVDDIKLLDDVELIQRAEGFVPSVWRNNDNGFLLGVMGFELLPADWNAESRIVLVTIDPVLDRMNMVEMVRLFKLVSHRSPLQHERDGDAIWEFKCGCGAERGIHLSSVGATLLGNFDCYKCGQPMLPTVRVFHEAYVAQKKSKGAPAAPPPIRSDDEGMRVLEETRCQRAREGPAVAHGGCAGIRETRK